MIPPHELKSRAFTKALRGYNTVEVDEHIEFIIEKYTEMYRENSELERKLRVVSAQLDEYKKDEESIRSALINAQKASSKILGEANERADVIIRSAKSNCDKVLSDFRANIKRERETLAKLQRTIESFKSRLFTEYREHIEYIEQISPVPDDDNLVDVPDDYYTHTIIGKIKADMAAAGENTAASGTADISPLAQAQKNALADDAPAIEYAPGSPDQDSFMPADETGGGQNMTGQNAWENAFPTSLQTEDDLPPQQEELDLIDELYNDADDAKDSGEIYSEPCPEDFDSDTGEDSQYGPDAEKTAGDIKTEEIFALPDPDGGAASEHEPEPINAERAAVNQTHYHSSSVMDTIRELNMKFSDEPEPELTEADTAATDKYRDSAIRDSGETPTKLDADDEEILSMIRNITNSSQKSGADSQKTSKSDKKEKAKALSLTEEFDMVYSDDRKKENK